MREGSEGGGEVNVTAGGGFVGGTCVCVGIWVNVADGAIVGEGVEVAVEIKIGTFVSVCAAG